MEITLKIAGVPSSSIGALHEAVRKIDNKHVVTIEESKFNSSHGDYAVTLKIEPKLEKKLGEHGTDDYVSYHPLSCLLLPLHAIDPHLFPEKETEIPTSATVKKLEKNKLREILRTLGDDLQKETRGLRGRKTKTTITAGHNPLLEPGDTYDSKENEFHFQGESLRRLILPAESDDPFMISLQKIQGILSQMDDLEDQLKK